MPEVKTSSKSRTRRFLAYLCLLSLREKVGRGAEHGKAMLSRSACIKGAVGAQSPHFGERRGVHRRCGPSQMAPQGPLAKKRETWYNKKAVYNFLKKKRQIQRGALSARKAGDRPLGAHDPLDGSIPSVPPLFEHSKFFWKEGIN